MYCEKCGSKIQQGAKFCEKCGSPLQEAGPGSKEKGSRNKWIVGVVTGGVVFVAVVVVGVLFATGNLGKKEKTVQTGSTRPDAGRPEVTVQPATADVPTASPESIFAVEPVNAAPTQQPSEMSGQSAGQSSEPAEQLAEQSVPEPAPADEGDASEPDAAAPGVSMNDLQLVTATSELSERNMVHSAERICDGSLKNAWVEGASGQGIGEEITFIFDDSYSFSGMKINAGYQKSKDLYYKNSRPQKIRITFSDHSSITVKLKDHYGVQKIDFDHPVVSDQVTVAIESVYKGNKYADTVISELEWY